MLSNNVEFSRDASDGMYVATIKLVNKQSLSIGDIPTFDE